MSDVKEIGFSTRRDTSRDPIGRFTEPVRPGQTKAMPAAKRTKCKTAIPRKSSPFLSTGLARVLAAHKIPPWAISHPTSPSSPLPSRPPAFTLQRDKLRTDIHWPLPKQPLRREENWDEGHQSLHVPPKLN